MRAKRMVSTALAIAIALAGASCGGDGSDRTGDVKVTNEDGPVAGATEPGAKTTATESTQATGTGETGDGTGGGVDPDPEKGQVVFEQSGCGGCHTLAAAGAEGSVGPNLDEAEPSFDDAVEQITNGGGGMPAYSGILTEREIEDVASFVVEARKG